MVDVDDLAIENLALDGSSCGIGRRDPDSGASDCEDERGES